MNTRQHDRQHYRQLALQAARDRKNAEIRWARTEDAWGALQRPNWHAVGVIDQEEDAKTTIAQAGSQELHECLDCGREWLYSDLGLRPGWRSTPATIYGVNP